MGAMAIGTVLGATLGAATGTQAGAFIGAVLGLTAGIVVLGISWMRVHAGNSPVLENHRILCTPNGRVADCEIEGDLASGRWYDVHKCSLMSPENDVYCAKTCLHMINDNGVRPGGDCNCH